MLAAGVLLTQLYTLRFIAKVIVGTVRAPPLAGNHDQDRPTRAAIILLRLPAFTGGMVFLSTRAYQIGVGITPTGSKLLILSLWVAAASFRWALYRNGLSERPRGDFITRMWLLPGFSGQFLLPRARQGDPLHKALGLGYLELTLGA